MNAGIRAALMYGGGRSIYVDAVAGSDANAGTSEGAPIKTLGKATTVLGTADGARLFLRRGSEFRGEQLYPLAPGLIVSDYGDQAAAAPRILRSTIFADAWALVSGTVYSSTLAYTPKTLAWVKADGSVVKVKPGTFANLTVNQFAVSAGVLRINIGQDPTGERIEVPDNLDGTLTTSFGLRAGAANQTFKNIDILFGPGGGVYIAVPNATFRNCAASYNAYDGFDQSGPAATGFLLSHCTMNYNGDGTGLAGPGDGTSAHDLAQGVIEYCTIIGNTGTGVGNEPDTNVVSRYCYLSGNPRDWYVYNQPGGSAGDHTVGYHELSYSIISASLSTEICVQTSGNAVPAMVVRVHNVTEANLQSGTFCPNRFSGGVVDFKNNVVKGAMAYGLAQFAGTVTSDFNQFGVATAMYQAGQLPSVAGASDALGDPLLSNPGAGDFRLTASSPALHSGTPLGYARDYVDAVVSPSAPTRGALESAA